MSGDFSTNNDMLKSYSSTIMKDEYFANLCNGDIEAQKTELNKLFTTIDDNNASAEDKTKLSKRAEELKAQLDEFQSRMAEIKEDIEANQNAIDAMANEIANLALDANNESEKLSRDAQEWTKECIANFFKDCVKVDRTTNQPLIKEGDRENVLQNRLAQCPNKSYKVEDIIKRLKSKQNEITPMVDKIDAWNKKIGSLETQYGAIKSAYTVINKNIQQIGNTDTSYTNSDYDNKAPIYSLEKLGVVSALFANPNMNVDATNTNYDENSKKPTLESIKEKYGDLYSKTASSDLAEFDQYSTDNKAVVNLGKAVEQGLLTDLLQAGLDKDAVGKFLAENFAGAQIFYDDNGVLNIPWGHRNGSEATHEDSKAREIFTGIMDFFDNPSYIGSENTWSEAGNTIDSNKQIEALSKNYKDIFKQMQNSGFTFKEAMYALFDKNNGMFKDCGINFNLGELGADGEPIYSIDLAGDEKTAEMYEDIAAQIKEIWGVDAFRSSDAKRFDDDAPVETAVIDPISFKKDGVEYAFTFDRNQDGVFNGINEFAGADSSTNWFADLMNLDADKNGILEGEELEKVMLLSTKYDDNAKTEKNEDGFLRSETTDVNYTIQSAASLGITKIDLTAYKNGEKQVGDAKGEKDINGAEMFNDGFTVEFSNGTTIEATRKDDTSAFMNAIYGAAEGKSYKLGLSEEDSKNVLDSSYGEFEEWKSQFNKVLVEDATILKDYGDTVKDVESNYDQNVQKAKKTTDLLARRAYNKIDAMPNFKTWDDIREDCRKALESKGLNFTANAEQQIKGICNRNNITSANTLVQMYLDQIKEEKENGIDADQ